MDNISVKLEDLPCSVRGFVVRCFDENEIHYTVILNAKLSDEQQRRTYEHEVEHIRRSDFDSNLSADYIESMRHRA